MFCSDECCLTWFSTTIWGAVGGVGVKCGFLSEGVCVERSKKILVTSKFSERLPKWLKPANRLVSLACISIHSNQNLKHAILPAFGWIWTIPPLRSHLIRKYCGTTIRVRGEWAPNGFEDALSNFFDVTDVGGSRGGSGRWMEKVGTSVDTFLGVGKRMQKFWSELVW
jgi:hypothetical protein